MDKKETLLLEFDAARESRRFEIQMFWQRSNYFLALNSALAVGYFAVEGAFNSIVIAFIGGVAAFLWYRTNLGAKYWQKFWEAEVQTLAKELKIRAFALSDDEILESTRQFGATKNKFWLKSFVDRQVDQKPSVSFNMILLSLFACAIWVTAVAAQMLALFVG